MQVWLGKASDSGLGSCPLPMCSFWGAGWRDSSCPEKLFSWCQQRHKRTSPTGQTHCKPLFVSCLLTSHWLNQVTWLHPKGQGSTSHPPWGQSESCDPTSVGRGRIYSSHGGEEGREGICFRIMESTHILDICWGTRFFEIQMKSAQNSPGQCYHPVSPGTL